MAAELSFRDETTGTTMRATIRKALTEGGKVRMWQTAGTPGWEDMTVANWANYILTLTETPGSSYCYIGDWPATLTTVGWYAVDIYRGTAISSVLAATLFGYWDGLSFILGAADTREVSGTPQSNGDLYAAIISIGFVGTQVAYYADPLELNITQGTPTDVDLTKTASHDDTYIQIGEIGGNGNGFDFDITSTGNEETDEAPVELHITGHYNGSSSHYVQVYLWNYALAVSGWELAGIMNSRSAEFNYTFPLTVDNHDTDTGVMKVRFLHVGTTGNGSHYIRINWLQWDKQLTDSETAQAIAAIKAKTDRLQFTTADNVKADTEEWKGETPNNLNNGYVPAWDYGLNRGSIHSGTVYDATANTITIADELFGEDGSFVGCSIYLDTAMTGGYQIRRIVSYDAATATATVEPEFSPLPVLATFMIFPHTEEAVFGTVARSLLPSALHVSSTGNQPDYPEGAHYPMGRYGGKPVYSCGNYYGFYSEGSWYFGPVHPTDPALDLDVCWYQQTPNADPTNGGSGAYLYPEEAKDSLTVTGNYPPFGFAAETAEEAETASTVLGAGAISTTITVKTTGGDPLDGAAVWITTDAAGTNVIAGKLYTNASGVVTFMLDAGTYYVWRQLSGYNFTNPQAITVS